MTTPYSPATATADAFGATDQGYVETDGIVPWDTSVARYNAQSLLQQAGALAVDQRDQAAALRRALAPAATATVRILSIGDSITVGYGSADNQGYRPWLTDLIERQCIQPLPAAHARGGWRLADARTGLAAALTANTPDIVLIALGTNEYLPFASAQTSYQAAYGQVIDQILASSSTVKVACALIPGTQDTGVQANVARANAAIEAAVNARAATGRVVLSDQRRTTSAEWTVRATDGSEYPPSRWTFDGIHPTDAGYLRMAQAWLAAIQAGLPTP